MALTIYEGIKDDQQVDENIDEEILRLLGLEDVSDLDYDEYKTLLRERIAAGRMPDNDIPSEDTERLTEEFKRVKKETGRFKVKREKIDFSKFTEKAKEETESKEEDVTPLEKLLPTSSPGPIIKKIDNEEEKETEVKSDEPQDVMEFLTAVVAPSLTKIETSLFNILSNLSSQQQAEDKAAEKGRVAGQKEKKRDKEEKQESGKGLLDGLGNVGKKVLSPLSGLFSSIFKFLYNIVLGMLALGVLEFLKDPGKIFRDIGNTIIDFFNGFIKSVFDFVFFPMNTFINLINGAVNEFEFAINNTIGKIPGIPDLKLPDIPNIEAPQIPRIEPPPEKTEKPKDPAAKVPIPAAAMTGGGEVTDVTNNTVGSNITNGNGGATNVINNNTSNSNTNKYYQLMEGGGKVRTDSGEKVTGAGSDTQLVALQPGEVVMSKPAVDTYGADTLLGMNAAAGGTNSPKMAKVQSASGGGLIPAMQGGGYVGASNVVDTGYQDYKGRPVMLAPPAASAFKQMVSDGMPYNPADVANVYRDKTEYNRLKNQGYSPASNSFHNHGEAADIHGAMNTWIRKNGAKYGWKANDYSGSHGGHFEYKGGGSGKTQVDPQETVTGKPKPSSGGGGSSKGRWGPILDLIAEGESDTSGGYDAMNPGRNTKAEGKPITQMTMKQVRDMAMSSTKGTGAAGRYQIMPVYNGVNVFKQLVESVGLNYETDIFSPENQDKMGIYRLAVTRGGNDWLSGKMSDEAFGKGISYEWAALKSKSGGAYDGDGRNKSTIGYNRVLKAMGDVKSGRGVSTEDLRTPNQTPGSSESPQVSTSSSTPAPALDFSPIAEMAGTPGVNNQSTGFSTEDLTIPSMTPGSSSLPIVSPKVKPSSRSNIQPPKSRTGSGGIVPLPIPGQKQPTSSSGGNQTDAPMFSSTDQNNPELLVIKSIYNIVG